MNGRAGTNLIGQQQHRASTTLEKGYSSGQHVLSAAVNMPQNISIDVDSISLNNAQSNVTTNKLISDPGHHGTSTSNATGKKSKKGASQVNTKAAQISQLKQKHGVNIRY